LNERPYHSIGEVLGLLLEEFPDVTISKIRFLESQGLIDPERTSSGYRKFYEGDIDRLRFILREQKDHYLPLRVIKERLARDETLPNPPRPVPIGASWASSFDDHDPTPTEPPRRDPLAAVSAGAGETSTAQPDPEPPSSPPVDPAVPMAGEPTPVSIPRPDETMAVVHPTAGPSSPAAGRRSRDAELTAEELCAQAGISLSLLRQLEEYGLIGARTAGGGVAYDAYAAEIAAVASRLLAHGLEVRHLRTWLSSADKEASLVEQLVVPLLRQRNPQARQHATALAAELVMLGAELREALVHQALGAYLEH
jgi:DNA-binding transcriptional MerR regulator